MVKVKKKCEKQNENNQTYNAIKILSGIDILILIIAILQWVSISIKVKNY